MPRPAALLVLALAGCKEGLLEPERSGDIGGVVVDVETGVPLADATLTTSPASDAPAASVVSDGVFPPPADG
jgi:hypothetical protein